MISFKEFLVEMGGWSKTVTQDVKLSPAIAKDAIAVMPKFEKDFNAYLKKNNYTPIKIGKAVGSTAYHEKDLKDNPTKEYGDIDIIFSIPRIDGLGESKNTSVYRDLVKSFINDVKPKYLYDDGDQNGMNIIVDADGKWVQVDLVVAFNDTEDWTTHRMTPEHNLKGSFVGFLYASLAETLNVSIGTSGVQVKHIGSEIVPYKKIKVDRVETISTDIGKFALDILNYFFARTHEGKAQPQIASKLKSMPGMNRDKIQIKDLAQAVKGLGESFELNKMFGGGDLKHVKNYSDFISQIKTAYARKADDAANATKFDKAVTPEAKKRAEDTKHLLRTKTKELLELL